MPLSKEAFKTIHLIAQSGSFAIAAERINRVPSAISYTVKKWKKSSALIYLTVKGDKLNSPQPESILLPIVNGCLIALKSWYATVQ